MANIKLKDLLEIISKNESKGEHEHIAIEDSERLFAEGYAEDILFAYSDKKWIDSRVMKVESFDMVRELVTHITISRDEF